MHRKYVHRKNGVNEKWNGRSRIWWWTKDSVDKNHFWNTDKKIFEKKYRKFRSFAAFRRRRRKSNGKFAMEFPKLIEYLFLSYLYLTVPIG